jgi:hypothetical protein
MTSQPGGGCRTSGATLCRGIRPCDTAPVSGSVVSVFVGYARKDAKALADFRMHTAALRRQPDVVFFDDTDLGVGRFWEDELVRALDSCDIAVFLITPAFIASAYCMDQELARALERWKAGACRIVPVRVRKFHALQDDVLSRLEWIPNPDPVMGWPDGESDAWVEVAKALAREIASVRRAVPMAEPQYVVSGPVPRSDVAELVDLAEAMERETGGLVAHSTTPTRSATLVRHRNREILDLLSVIESRVQRDYQPLDLSVQCDSAIARIRRIGSRIASGVDRIVLRPDDVTTLRAYARQITAAARELSMLLSDPSVQ